MRGLQIFTDPQFLTVLVLYWLFQIQQFFSSYLLRMKRRELEAFARYGFEGIITAPTLSELSISEIKELRPSEESIEVEPQRELIRHFPKAQNPDIDNYGIRHFAGVSFRKREQATGKGESKSKMGRDSYVGSEQVSELRGRQKSLSFNKDLRRKKQSLKIPDKHKSSAGTLGKHTSTLPLRLNQATTASQPYQTQSLSIVNPFKLPPKLSKPLISFECQDVPIVLSSQGRSRENVVNPYYLRPDDIKFEVNDIHSEFSYPTNFGFEPKAKNGQLSRCSKDSQDSLDSPFHLSQDAPHRYSHDLISTPLDIKILSRSQKVIQVKREKSLDLSRDLTSQKGVDSPFSRDSNSTAANGLNSSNHTKHGSEYYTGFKRGSR